MIIVDTVKSVLTMSSVFKRMKQSKRKGTIKKVKLTISFSRLNGVLKAVEKEVDEVTDSAQTSAEQDSCDQQPPTTAASTTTTLTATISEEEADPSRISDIETEISLERLGLGDRVPDIVVIEEEDEHGVADEDNSTDCEDPDKIEVQSEAESTRYLTHNSLLE